MDLLGKVKKGMYQVGLINYEPKTKREKRSELARKKEVKDLMEASFIQGANTVFLSGDTKEKFNAFYNAVIE